MRAIILAAGRGSRMGDRTADRPKCLTEVAGRTLLEWQIDALNAAGVDRLGVVAGYRAELLSGPFEVVLNHRWHESSIVVSLLTASAWLEEEPCLVSYSDIVFHPDHVRRLAAATAGIAITYDRQWESLWRHRFSDPLQDAERFIETSGRVEVIGGRATTLEEIQGQYMGLLRFTPAGWLRVRQTLAHLSPSAIDSLDLTSLLRYLLAQGVEVGAVPVDGRWCEVDSSNDADLYETLLAGAGTGQRWSHDWRTE